MPYAAGISDNIAVFVDKSFIDGVVSQLTTSVQNQISSDAFNTYARQYASKNNGRNGSSTNNTNPGNSSNNQTGNPFRANADLTKLFASYSSVNDWAGLLGSYSSMFTSVISVGNATGNSTSKNKTSILGNFTFNSNNAAPNSFSVESVLTLLYSQRGFKRFFNGTFAQLISSNASAYFDFSSAPASCAGCLKGFSFDSATKICSTCQPNCLNCNTTNCIACATGFVVFNNTQCVPCQAPCATCGPSASTCITCVSPYSLSAGSCVRCSPPCLTCQSANTSSCITCSNPFSSLANDAG